MRLALLFELAGYGLAIAFAIVFDPRLLIAEAALACLAIGRALDGRPQVKP